VKLKCDFVSNDKMLDRINAVNDDVCPFELPKDLKEFATRK